MHPVNLTQEEVDLVKKAKMENNWRILPTFKLKYLYQRLVCAGKNDGVTIHEIQTEARKFLGKSPIPRWYGLDEKLEAIEADIRRGELWCQLEVNQTDETRYSKALTRLETLYKERDELKDSLDKLSKVLIKEEDQQLIKNVQESLL